MLGSDRPVWHEGKRGDEVGPLGEADAISVFEASLCDDVLGTSGPSASS